MLSRLMSISKQFLGVHNVLWALPVTIDLPHTYHEMTTNGLNVRCHSKPKNLYLVSRISVNGLNIIVKNGFMLSSATIYQAPTNAHTCRPQNPSFGTTTIYHRERERGASYIGGILPRTANSAKGQI